MLIWGIRLLKYVLIPNVPVEIKSKKEYLRELGLLVFAIFKQTEIKEMFPPVLKCFCFTRVIVVSLCQEFLDTLQTHGQITDRRSAHEGFDS